LSELSHNRTIAQGPTGLPTYRELLTAPDVDAVIIVVPPTAHVDIATAAAAAHRPVLLEKPAAPSVAIGRQMLHTVRRAERLRSVYGSNILPVTGAEIISAARGAT
jgi:predicted dehydrogenase